MRNLKKFLALVLAMMMAFSLVITANAKSVEGPFNDESGVVEAFKEGVDVVTGMKIFKGDAGTKDFRPSANIKRSEVAAIVYRLVTGDVEDTQANLYTHVAPFSDVNPTDWFAGYVGYLWNAEIIKGSNTERTQFNPYGEVTGYEALAMVLRAMGYDANDEFTGAGWQIRVGQTANTSGLLVNVNTTNYGAGHLNAAARRDTVAEILFQAATKPTVVYTPAFGYQTGNVNAGLNHATSSLGWTNFGLTWDRGIVVGNQSTGESATKMGIATVYRPAAGSVAAAEVLTGGISNDSYIYGGVDIIGNANHEDNGALDATSQGSWMLNFDHTTPLGQFGHANKVWYNANASSGGAGKYHTYAWFDEATKTAIVHTEGTDDLSAAGTGVYTVAKAEGFNVDDIDAIFGSDKYDRMGPLNDTAVSDTTVDAKTDVESPNIHMWSLISNSANGKLDVVISLEAEVAKIWDTNNTSTSERIVLANGQHGGPVTATTTTARNGVEILVSHLTPDSVRTLGTDVTSWVVDGTALVNGVIPGDPGMDINSFYETIAVQQGPSGTVSTMDAEGTITLTNGQTLKKSYLCDVIRTGVSFIPANDAVISAGVTYNFVVDQWGRYLGLSTNPGETFIYGTFADHSYGAVGSGDLNYFVYGVDANGGKIVDHALTQLRLGADAIHNAMNGAEFNRIEVARRDYGNTADGNQVAGGVYRGGWITADGKWRVNDEANTQFANTLTKGTSNNWSDAEDWEITSTDAARGFLDVSADNSGRLLITNDTVFYVVSGTGTSTLNVKTYNGMTGFLDGATKAQIETTYKDGNVGDNSYDVCFMTNADTYNSVGEVTTQNRMITKVFVYENAVRRNNTTTMYYVHDNSATGLTIAGDTVGYAQYEMWQGATKTNVFLTDAPTEDTFYNLEEFATVNGIKVYTATAVGEALYTAGGSCLENEPIDYFATNNTSTARIGGDDVAATVYGVKDAVVIDLTKKSTMHSDAGCLNDGAHDAHNEIDSVAKLFNAISVGYSVNVSVVNTSSNVTLIYVVHVDDATIGRT